MTALATRALRPNYLNAAYGVKSWLLTKDHKRIALLYLASVTLFFVVGGVFAGLIRLELLTPQGDLVTSDTYNRLFTMHGVVMIFFFLIPAVPAVLGNFLLPLMLGAKDLAFPRINLLSWYVYMVGGALGTYALVQGGADTGWTFYPPFSTRFSNSPVTLVALAGFVAGFSSILTALNFIVTTHRMRAPGLTWFRLPLFVWSTYATSVIIMLATPVLAITLVTIVAAFYNQHLMEFLSDPVPRCTKGLGETTGGACAVVAYTDLLSPFTTTVKVSLMAGIVLSSPVWLYQLWAFVAPGLHKHERKYTYYFVAAAVPQGNGAATFVPMHWGTFRLTDEPLDEPPRRLRTAWAEAGLAAERLCVLAHGETLVL